MPIEILVAPNLRISWMKTVAHLKKANYDRLFLNFPQNLEYLTTELSEDRLTYEDFIKKVRKEKLVPEPIGSWMYTAEPMLQTLKKMRRWKSAIKIYCYKGVEHNQVSARIASEIAALTLQTSLTEKVNVEKWKDAVEEGMKCKNGALRDEANFVHERASYYSICASGFDGRSLQQRLTEKGEEVNLTNIEEFYYPTPLETLEEKLMEGDLPDEEVEELVKDHIEYVKNYILRSKNRDQAYYQWVYDKVPSLRQKIDPKEIKYLDVLLNSNNV